MSEITNGQTAGLRGNTPSFEYITTKTPVVSGVSTTRTLNESESGSIIVLDRVGGTVFTLPTGKPGINFTFLADNANASAIVTNIGTSTPIIIGSIATVLASSMSNGSMFVSTSASAYVRIITNATTTGGIQGSKLVLTALSSGTWFVSGTLIGSGALTTPFSAASA